jgi:hypothetical protein
MKYSCLSCKYYTNKKTNIETHHNSVRHKYAIIQESYALLKEDSANKIQELKAALLQITNEKSAILEKALDKAHETVDKVLDNNKLSIINNGETNKITSKSLSTMSYIIKYCSGAPDIDSLDVENKLMLTPGQCRSALFNPMNIAVIAAENYFDPDDFDFNSFYCNDQARKKYMAKKDGRWVNDPGGDLIKEHITKPIAYKIHSFNEDMFKLIKKKAGGARFLTDTQIKNYGKNVATCANLLSDKVQNKIMKRLVKCQLVHD